MARKNQKLINYHTGKKAEMPVAGNVDYGEIVVRHNAESPELLIKIGEDSFGVFQASGAVKTAIDSAVSTAKTELNGDISDLQSDINSLSSATKTLIDEVSAATKATYATKAELKSTSGSIISDYTTAIGAAKKAVYDSATSFTTKEVNTLSTTISGVRSDLNELSGVVKSISTDIGSNYVTTGKLETTVTTLEGKISTAQKAATDASSAYTDTQIAAAKKYTDDQIKTSETTTNGLINGLDSRVDTLETTVAANKKDVVDNYVSNTKLSTTVSTLEGKISTAQKAATDASSAYTDTKFTAAKSYTDTEIENAKSAIKQTTDTLNSKIDTFSGNVETTLDALENTLTNTINNKVSVAYRYQGSVTNYADLPKNLTSGETGYVYNVENANGHIPAGTNYAWNGTAWDALGGIVDLSPYAKTADVNKEITSIKQTNTNLQSAIDSVSSATKTLINEVSAATKATYATKTALQTAQNDITTAYTQAIANAKKEAIETASGYTDTQVLAAKNALNQSIQDVDGRVTDLSGVTKTVKATADSAVQNATVNSNAKVTKKGTSLDFDFSGLIIDCGDF